MNAANYKIFGLTVAPFYGVHLIAAAFWLGGTAVLVLYLIPALEKTKKTGGAEIQTAVVLIRGFQRAAAVCAAIMLATGIPCMLLDENHLGFLKFGNAWSKLMLAKHVLFVCLLTVAVVGGIAASRRLKTPGADGAENDGGATAFVTTYRKYGLFCLILSIAILLVTGWLTAQ